jgi:hypothetical protein
MIGGRGYEARGPLCLLAPGNCGAILVGSSHRPANARGPPLRQARQVSAGRSGLRAECNSCQT